MRKFSVCLFIFFVSVAQTKEERINYDTLDYKYYPYIVFYGDYSDKGIAKLIEDVDNGEDKSGLFLGIALGGISSTDINQDARFSYGVKLGYQSFLPSFFERLSRPGVLGNRIYLEYHSAMSQQGVFGLEKFSNISLAYDVLLDLHVAKGWDAGIIVGIGIGNSIYGDDSNSHPSFLTNTGFGISFLKHNRVDFELKIIPSLNFDWFGGIFTVGYNYVF